tara:strand:- start:163 stop:564 length:402 start_codon:yes stop_codon:yes gene_type:complete
MNNLNNIQLNVARVQTSVVIEGMKDLLRKNGIAFRFEMGELDGGFQRGHLCFKLTEQGFFDFMALPLDVRQNLKRAMLRIACENGCMFSKDFNPCTLPTLNSEWASIYHCEQLQRWESSQAMRRMAERRLAAC